MRKKLLVPALLLVSMLFLVACDTEPDPEVAELQAEIVELRQDFNTFTEEWATFQSEWGTFMEGAQ